MVNSIYCKVQVQNINGTKTEFLGESHKKSDSLY